MLCEGGRIHSDRRNRSWKRSVSIRIRHIHQHRVYVDFRILGNICTIDPENKFQKRHLYACKHSFLLR